MGILSKLQSIVSLLIQDPTIIKAGKEKKKKRKVDLLKENKILHIKKYIVNESYENIIEIVNDGGKQRQKKSKEMWKY